MFVVCLCFYFIFNVKKGKCDLFRFIHNDFCSILFLSHKKCKKIKFQHKMFFLCFASLLWLYLVTKFHVIFSLLFISVKINIAFSGMDDHRKKLLSFRKNCSRFPRERFFVKQSWIFFKKLFFPWKENHSFRWSSMFVEKHFFWISDLMRVAH